MTAEKIDAAMQSIGRSGLVYKTELENMQQLENSGRLHIYSLWPLL